MPAFPRSPVAGSIAAMAMAAALTFSVNASAQTSHRPAHHRTHVASPQHPVYAPLAPGVDLTYANPGSENHYYSDTVAAGHADLQDIRYRYGQSPSTQYNSDEPLFRF
jgi:hypothetical protein